MPDSDNVIDPRKIRLQNRGWGAGGLLTGRFGLSDGSASSPSLYFLSDPDTGLYYSMGASGGYGTIGVTADGSAVGYWTHHGFRISPSDDYYRVVAVGGVVPGQYGEIGFLQDGMEPEIYFYTGFDYNNNPGGLEVRGTLGTGVGGTDGRLYVQLRPPYRIEGRHPILRLTDWYENSDPDDAILVRIGIPPNQNDPVCIDWTYDSRLILNNDTNTYLKWVEADHWLFVADGFPVLDLNNGVLDILAPTFKIQGQTVSFGVAGSGGSGYKLLRVPDEADILIGGLVGGMGGVLSISAVSNARLKVVHKLGGVVSSVSTLAGYLNYCPLAGAVTALSVTSGLLHVETIE